MESKTVSLVIGTKDPAVGWFNQALRSADGLFDEIIIVDDGSDVKFDFQELYPKETFVIRHLENKGFFEARNTGCKIALGEWIASLDDDDFFLRDNVDKLKEFLKTTDADIVHFPCEMIGNQNGLWGHDYNLDKFLDANQIPSGSWFKKKVWEKLKGFQLPEGEDWDFWARAHKHGFKFAYFPLPVYKHRMRADSMSAKWIGDKFLEIRDNVRKNYEKEQTN